MVGEWATNVTKFYENGYGVETMPFASLLDDIAFSPGFSGEKVRSRF